MLVSVNNNSTIEDIAKFIKLINLNNACIAVKIAVQWTFWHEFVNQRIKHSEIF